MNETLRSWSVTKTQQGRSKVTLYEEGRPVFAAEVASVVQGNQLGRAWGDSSEVDW